MKKVEEKLKYLYTMTANYPNQSPRLILEGKNVIMSINLPSFLSTGNWRGESGEEPETQSSTREKLRHKRKNEVWLRDLMESRKEIVTFESGLQ